MKIEWIECNLPWYTTSYDKIPSIPDISQREKEVFGITIEESRALITKEESDIYCEFKTNKQLENNKDHPAVIKVLKHQELVKQICDWSDAQPEYKEWNALRKKICEENDKKSFSKSLYKVGTLFELEDGRIFLIGHYFDDNNEFHDSDIVKRYAVLIDMDELKSEK